MSDSSRVQLFQMPEVTYGVIPGTALKELRFTGESLKFNIATTQSQEIRSDRQITDLPQVGADVNGGFNFELSYNAYDDLIEGAMLASWGSTLTLTAATISAAASDNSLNFSGNNCPAFVAGQWVKITGFTGGSAGLMPAYAQVVSRTVSKLVVSGVTLVDDAAGESVTVVGTMIRNGTTKKSFVMEKFFSDVTQYQTYTGCMVQQWDLEVSANQILKGKFDIMGKTALAMAGSTAGTGGPTAAPTKDVLNATSNVATIREGGAALSGTFAQNLKISLNNNLRAQPGIGVLGTTGIGMGTSQITGSIEFYFTDATIYNKFRNNTASSLSFRVADAAGNTMIVTMPRIKYSDGNVGASGINQDVIVPLSFQAIRDPVTNCTIQVDRFDGP